MQRDLVLQSERAWQHVKNNRRNLKVAIELRGMIAKKNREVTFDAPFSSGVNSMTHAIRLITCVIIATISSAIAPAQTDTPDRLPNIVLLIADDLGYGELGCQGNPQIPTPHIDAIAASGVRCVQAYVTAPNCSPSRAGLFSGRTPTRFGYEFNPIGARNEDHATGLPKTELTLAEFLRDAGYTTALIGKWHLGGTADYHPLRRGFDEFFGFLHEGHFYVPPPWSDAFTMLRRRTLPAGGERYQAAENLIYSSHMGHNEPPYDANNPLLRGGQPIVESEYLTDAFTREATDFIDRHAQTPFFLCVTYNAVHSPLQAKLQTLERFDNISDIQRRIFAAMLSDLDTSVGAITRAISAQALDEQTLVFFLSDNGGPTRELTSSNLPLRDGKGSMYEGGLRVPFLVKWPTHLPAGGVCTEVVSSLDIFTTVARLTRGAPPDKCEGQDLLPLLLEQRPSQHETLYWRQGNRAALRHGPWKIVAPKRQQSQRLWELYNIDSDIGESRDLAAENPTVLEELQHLWEQWDQEMADPLFR
jgi:arylsulfatase A-like enzyme